jgi:hypothetical protein
MDLVLDEMKTNEFTQRIHHGMDLVLTSTFAASAGLFALLLRASALGW